MAPPSLQVANHERRISIHDAPTPTAAKLTGESGILVLLMGQTGAGKSHFINVAAGREIAPECHELTGSRDDVQEFRVTVPSVPSIGSQITARSVVLVDTPGLNHYERSDLDILKQISAWIEQNCRSDVRIGGILFLQDITLDKATELEGPFIWPVIHLSSPELIKRLLLATGKWDRVKAARQDLSTFLKREENLLRTRAWSFMIKRGAQRCRFEGDCVSAWNALNQLLALEPQPVHILQQDLIKIRDGLGHKGPKKRGFLSRLKGLFSRNNR